MKTRLTLTVVLSALLLVVASVSSPVDARWYDPESGRFVSRDPALDARRLDSVGIPSLATSEPGALNQMNPYVYCGNNPMVYVDPTGGCGGSGGINKGSGLQARNAGIAAAARIKASNNPPRNHEERWCACNNACEDVASAASWTTQYFAMYDGCMAGCMKALGDHYDPNENYE